jgi:catechol 2,3-dioxygenase-like lactoylglutathione lyase family enzyme
VTRLVDINHVALEVGDVEEALSFYGRFFEFTLRGRSHSAAFVDIGDQFLALMERRSGGSDGARHFGLVVDDTDATRRELEAAGVEIRSVRGLDFLDPWGNYVQVVQYDEVQFTKASASCRGWGSSSARARRPSPSFEPKTLPSRARDHSAHRRPRVALLESLRPQART